MNKPPSDAPYTLRTVAQMLGLGRGVIEGLIGAGYVSPARGPRNGYRFSFQDVVVLRMAYQLKAASIPPRRMLRSLRQIKARLPPDVTSARELRVKAIGNDVAVRNAQAHWEAATGQLLMDFDQRALSGTVSPLLHGRLAGIPRAATADSWFSRAQELEDKDKAAARAAYREALELAPDHMDAYVNLGAMLCEAGEYKAAIGLLDEALQRCPDAPLLHFNRAIALEDQKRHREALDSYERCLELEPRLADAHYNAARLHELLGNSQAALRHYSAYRRLQQ